MVEFKDYNKLAEYFVFDLASAVDEIGDLHRCETKSLLCDIQYLKGKVADIKFELFSMYDRLCNSGDDKN